MMLAKDVHQIGTVGKQMKHLMIVHGQESSYDLGFASDGDQPLSPRKVRASRHVLKDRLFNWRKMGMPIAPEIPCRSSTQRDLLAAWSHYPGHRRRAAWHEE